MCNKKTILIVGGNGFIGRNIVSYISGHYIDEYQVIIADIKRFDFGLELETNWACLEHIYIGDILNYSFLETIFSNHKVNLVVHAQGNVTPTCTNEDSIKIMDDLKASFNIVRVMGVFNVRDIIFISSAGAVYGNTRNKNKETDPTNPVSAYGFVKIAIENYLMDNISHCNLRPLVVRLSNVYGEYHTSRHNGLCNIALRNTLRGNETTIWGDGTGSKDYIYAEDAVDIILQLYRMEIFNEIINIASEQEYSVNYILKLIKSIYPNCKWKYSVQKTSDVTSVRVDISKLKGYIGEFKFTSLEDGIKNTNKWEIYKIQYECCK